MAGPPHRRWLPLIPAFVALVALLHARPATAFKPFMHNHSGEQALADVIADGQVTIDGRAYRVRDEVVAALRAWPQFYNAGVVGPDGFPDLVMGQSVIHPEETGRWLRHIYTRAWAAQTDPTYSPAERGQILAFTYGYLTHAAGDVWAHTLVNDFALGVFPGVAEIAAEREQLAVAIRHIIVEGYLGDATSGYDGNRESRTRLADGDWSDDSSPAIAYDAPHRFVYETLIKLDAGAPSTERGTALDSFFDLQANLQVARAQADFDARNEDCLSVSPGCETTSQNLTVSTVRGPRTVPVSVQRCNSNPFCLPSPLDAADDLVNPLLVQYLDAWIEDIEAGLRQWNRLGLAITKALFDPQTRRNWQNQECGIRGADAEDNLARRDCENALPIENVVFLEATPFIEEHLVKMLGAPDVSQDVLVALRTVSAFLDQLGIPFNPLREGLAEIREQARQIIRRAIIDAFGVDVALVHSFLTNPTSWLSVDAITLPGVGEVRLFFQGDGTRPSDHDRLDALMGLTGNHHADAAPPLPNFPVRSTRLSDAAETSADRFAALGNTVVLAKLLLLDGAELNRVLGDILAAEGAVGATSAVQSYPAMTGGVPTNIMVHGLGGEPWLRSIDSDHAWRADGRPRFCDAGSANCPGAGGRPAARPAALNGGNGNFPLWESCLLRPAFRRLFKDWENGNQNFPDLGDACTAGPGEPTPPAPPPPPPATMPPPAAGGTGATDVVQLVRGCNNVALTWAVGTPLGTAAAGVSPASALLSIFRLDQATNRFLGFAPGVPDFANDYRAIGAPLEAVFICMSAPGMLTRPVAATPADTVQLVSGCTNLALTWPVGTALGTVGSAVSPTGALRSIFRLDAASGRFLGFAPGVPDFANDYQRIEGSLEAVFVCTNAPGTLNRPAAGTPPGR